MAQQVNSFNVSFQSRVLHQLNSDQRRSHSYWGCMRMWPPRFLPSSCATLSRRRPRLTPSTTHMWRIETLMELAVLLCELLLCSFPNGEKFNYQLICCVVSSDTKFPIVSTSIKRSASAQLFRHWEQRTQVDTMKLSSDVTPCVPPTQSLQISFRSSSCSVVETDMHFMCT